MYMCIIICMLKLSNSKNVSILYVFMHQLSSILKLFLLSGLMGGPAHLARGLLGRHGPHKPYPGRAWAYKVARGPARPGPPTWSGLNRPGQDGPGPGRAARLAINRLVRHETGPQARA
jgi:hypothetical protein